MSTDEHAEVIKARITAAAKAPALDSDEIANLSALPANYVEVYLSRRFGGEARFDGSFEPLPWRLSTRVVSKSVTNARLMQDRIAADLEFQTITVAGRVSTPVMFETSDPIGPDEGWHTALTDWTYVL